ncbi:iron-sulfur cluster co-chaperone protein HscB, mitochondrial isoform X2 [Herrania umbratica]|uniref:Iron-sulfur cluster co-chaperone protein HscB, mitochondrial isoform X2 n=1 Tax=Herrania umbratica TaxID=108875 RepID=A0A6J1ARI1_9ROSI|nr:iron-sulfur cluster co-chaperone protein HscB, mitochondrial isoform X2 [Herrania umbratica]
MYQTKKLWTPLSTIARRALPTTCHLTPYSPNSQIRSSSSPLETSSRVSLPLHYGLGNLKFSAKGFCSQSAAKVDATTKRCWNCDAVAAGMVPFLYCDSCRSIQPVDFSVDYFQIFGLEKKYEIEVAGLEGKYKDWQKKLHPDLVHSKSELRLEGVHVDEEQTVSDPELLTEIMEIREAVEEAMDSQALNQIESQMKEKLEGSSSSFANAYRSRNFDEAVTCIQRMTYYQRANEEILKKL